MKKVPVLLWYDFRATCIDFYTKGIFQAAAEVVCSSPCIVALCEPALTVSVIKSEGKSLSNKNNLKLRTQDRIF